MGFHHSQAFIDAVYAERGRLTGSQAGGVFGMSHNAVVGLWHRERIRRGEPCMKPTGPTLSEREKELSRLRRNARERERRQARERWVPPPPRPIEPIPEPPAMPNDGSSGIAFFDLQPDSCRYPLGEATEPARWFCGEWCVPGGSYCLAHQRLCYQRLPSRHERRAE